MRSYTQDCSINGSGHILDAKNVEQKFAAALTIERDQNERIYSFVIRLSEDCTLRWN